MGADGRFIPKIKLSENSEKVTNPGNKTIYRVYEKETGKVKADLICLVEETFDENEHLLLFDPNEPWKKTKLPGGSYTLRELMIPRRQMLLHLPEGHGYPRLLSAGAEHPLG